jgi:Ankyrin repeats (3 copies)
MPPEELTTHLFSAIKGYNLKEVESILTQGIDVNIKDQWDNILLVQAMQSTRAKDMVELLIKSGADVNLSDGEGVTALIRAARGGDIHIARLLIENGADVNAKNSGGESALHIAAQLGNTGYMKTLIDAKADLNSQDQKGETPLMVGASRIEVVKVLVEAGASPNITDISGLTALQKAQKKAEISGQKSNRVVEYLTPITASAKPGGIRGLLSKVFHTSGVPNKGWMVTEKWLDWKIASPELESQRVRVKEKLDLMRTYILARGDLPFGGYIVFSEKKYANEIADLLRQSGCPSVEVEEVYYEEQTDKWVAKN